MRNKLSINFKKTNIMIITTPKKKVNIRITTCNVEQNIWVFILMNICLCSAPTYQQLTNQKVGILYKLRHYVSLNTLKQIYCTLIYPYLNYGLINRVTACQTKLNKIKIRQNVVRESSTPCYALLEIWKLENVFNFKIGSLN